MKSCYDHDSHAGLETKPMEFNSEHDKIASKLDGRMHEIMFMPLPGGMVPANPFSSIQQAKFAHANPEKFGGQKGLKEWDSATDFKHLPKKVKH